MRVALSGVGGLVCGYVVGVAVGYAGTMLLSSNSHDRALEASFTGAFFTGPALAVLGGVVGALVGWFLAPEAG